MEHPDSCVLTADTSGPLKTPDMDSHQRGAKRAMKYMFMARRVPKVFLQTAGCPLKSSSTDEEVIVEEDGPDPLDEGEPDCGHVAREDPEDDMNLDGLFPSDGEEEADGVREDVGKETEEPSGSGDGKKEVKNADEVPKPLDDVEPPEMVSIVWVTSLADNKSPTVLEALQVVVYHARALNIPILRFHSDKSLEFYAKATRRWIKMNGMRMTARVGKAASSSAFEVGGSGSRVLAVRSPGGSSPTAVGGAGLHDENGCALRSQGVGQTEAV